MALSYGTRSRAVIVIRSKGTRARSTKSISSSYQRFPISRSRFSLFDNLSKKNLKSYSGKRIGIRTSGLMRRNSMRF